MCGLCFSNPRRAEHRRAVAESQKAKGIFDPRCARCGISEPERIRQFTEVEKSGTFIYLKDYPSLLYCENCDKYFCGRCQADLGMNAGCPECHKDLEFGCFDHTTRHKYRKPEPSDEGTEKVVVGTCEACNRPLRMKRRGVRTAMRLTCKCGHLNIVRKGAGEQSNE